jgi:calcineurin-like phosphoesterase family protein
MSEFVISDTHFNHANIIKYCNRPFNGVGEMNNALVVNWNEVVKPEDTVYHVGDFGLATLEQLKEIRQCLNGRIVLIKGNHDGGWIRMRDIGIDEFHKKDLLIWKGDTSIYFSHEPQFQRKGTIHFYGHVHDKTPPDEPKWAHNVSVEVIKYRPVLIDRCI